MPKHIYVEVARPWEFAKGVQLKKKKKTKGFFKKSIHPLYQIHTRLSEYDRLTWRSKANMRQRWDLLQQITQLCVQYIGSKPASKQSSERVKTVKRLRDMASMRLTLESQRAQELERRMNAPTTYVNVGGPSSPTPENRFERLNIPGQPSMKGEDLVALAARYGLKLTNDDVVNYYMMKKALKMFRTRETSKLNLIYFDEEQRAAYMIEFTDNDQVLDANGQKFDTRGWKCAGKINYAMWSASPDGAFYAAKAGLGETEGKLFHHSSFLGGATALCAGEIKVYKGRLREISNLSGHYGPKLKNLVDACAAILEAGYDPKDDGYALYCDFEKAFPQIYGAILRVPLETFVEMEGRPIQPERYNVDWAGDNSGVVYQDPYKAQQMGCDIPD